MKANGSYATSKPEKFMYEHLCERFSAENVEEQVNVGGWFIDFYVNNIDTYVQLDGVYWHGLNRTIEELSESKVPRDANILKTRVRDLKRESWFRENGKRLVRITDIELLACKRSDDFSPIDLKLESEK